MSGHSKWAQIKHQKGATDQKRGKLFSKLLRAISAAAKTDPDQKFNPRLRSAVEKAEEHNVPQENIARAISRAEEATENLEELVIEAYAPDGVAVLVEAVTDSRNRTVAEIKKLLDDYGGKWAEQGSVRWAFEKNNGGWEPKFTHAVTPAGREALEKLVRALENHDDVARVYTNAA